MFCLEQQNRKSDGTNERTDDKKTTSTSMACVADVLILPTTTMVAAMLFRWILIIDLLGMILTWFFFPFLVVVIVYVMCVYNSFSIDDFFFGQTHPAVVSFPFHFQLIMILIRINILWNGGTYVRIIATEIRKDIYISLLSFALQQNCFVEEKMQR